MIDPRLEAVRKVRVEADNLRLACVEAAGTRALLHVAYDRNVSEIFPIAETILMGALDGVVR
jgi:hypothetical protein